MVNIIIVNIIIMVNMVNIVNMVSGKSLWQLIITIATYILILSQLVAWGQ